ncbi:RNA-directed DNA polymerase [Tanacetum coccineum]
MPFRLCNAPTTFQRCMTAIFHELIEDSMEVFMDDFSVFGSSFEHCFKNLEKMLKRCEETNLVLNWEKCHSCEGIGSVLTESYKDAWPEIKQHKFFNNVTADHPGDIMASPPPQGRYFTFGRHLEELHVTWAHLEKKQTRLQTYTNITQDNVLSSWRRRHQYNMTPSQQRPKRRHWISR